MVIGKSGGGTGGGQVVGKKVAPVKQPLLRSKQATSESLLSLYSLCLSSTTISKSLSTSWPLPENYRLAAANCGRSWPRGWLLIRFDFPHQRLQGGLDWAAMDWLTMTTTIKICGRFFACCARGQPCCQVCLFSLFEFWQSPSLSETHSLTFDLFVFFLLISPPFFYQI